MKKTVYLTFTAAILLFTACSEEQKQRQSQGPMPYPVVQVPTKDVTGYKIYPAEIEGTISSAVRAKVSGYITDVLVDEGQKVQKGQTLFRLETQSLSQDAGAAKANVNAAQVEVNRLKPLVEKGIISDVQLETAEAKLAQAKASYNSISANIDYATIKSPVNGYVGAIPYRQGALVSPSDPTPLTTVSQVDEVYAYFSLNEKDYLNMLQSTQGKNLDEKIKNLPKVELELVNGKIYEHEGTIQTATGQVNTTTGTVSFRAIFNNPERLLANGNSARIRIPEVYENATVVPELSTYEQQGKVYVYKVVGDSVAISSPITVKDRINQLVVVESGIKPNEKIVFQGIGKLRNNTPIKPQPVSFDSVAQSLEVVFK
ncbi:hemolysin D [Marivirga lumbricoides]|uniref:Hemolysin D n=1 Tax=Marivirga lumbricoides TaxID=1046115 RepID=A0ABQ1MXV8_9BACT|nr:hemolysin D [Marivirga lumbricoides]